MNYHPKVIVYKMTDEWYIAWQQVTTSGTASENEWKRVKTNDNECTTNDNEWYNEWQQITMSNKKWL